MNEYTQPKGLFIYYVIQVGGGGGKPNADTLRQRGGGGVDKLLRITVTGGGLVQKGLK